MIMLCAAPACLKDIIFVTAYNYKLQTGSETTHGLCSCFSSLMDQGPLISRTQQSRQSFLGDCASQCHWASPCCQAFQCETSPVVWKLSATSLAFIPTLVSSVLPLLCSWFSPAQPPPASTCWHPGAPPAGPLWRSGVR